MELKSFESQQDLLQKIQLRQQKGLLLVLSGPSAGVGKDSVAQLLTQNGAVERVVTCTTRPPRAGEKEGLDYYFLTREEFEKRIDEGFFLEWEEYLGNFYGTPAIEVENLLQKGKDVLLRIDVRGALSVKKKFPHPILVFLTVSSPEVMRRRLEKRGENPAVIRDKLELAAKETEYLEYFDYLVFNEEGKLEATVAQIKAILSAEHARLHFL